jgi:hypothetical protein
VQGTETLELSYFGIAQNHPERLTLTNKRPDATSKRKEFGETLTTFPSNPGSSVWSDPFNNSFMSSLRYTSLEEEFATCFFFMNYVLDDQYSRGAFKHLIDIYRGETVSTSLADAVTSIGIAGPAHFYKDSSVMVNTNKKYSSALSSVSIRLRDSTSAKEDQTLMAVVLLGVYEVSRLLHRVSTNLTPMYRQILAVV